MFDECSSSAVLFVDQGTAGRDDHRRMTSLRPVAVFLAALLALPLLWTPSATAHPGPGHGSKPRHTQALERAHAHNDYEHARPLHDALSHGFTSVEADVWLVGDELLIGHDAPDPARTLQNTYLEPLRRVITENRGSVHRGGKARFRLYIDVKSGPETWAVIEKKLRDYRDIVTVWSGERRLPGAVEVVISGNRDLPAMEAADVRFSAYDGRLPDIYSGLSPELMTVLSDNWTKHFTWMGEGTMPAAERRKLHRIVKLAHAQGYEVRFWATPDAAGPAREAVWRELVAADVDQINTDDLAGLQTFLAKNDPTERRGGRG